MLLFCQFLFLFIRDTFAPKPNEKGELVNPEPYAILGNPTYSNLSHELTQIVRYFLTCQFEYLKIDDLLNFMFLNRNNTIEFYKCIRDFPKNEAYFPRYLGCIWELKQLCLKKEIIVRTSSKKERERERGGEGGRERQTERQRVGGGGEGGRKGETDRQRLSVTQNHMQAQ